MTTNIEPRLAADLWPTIGKRVLIAIDPAELDAARRSMDSLQRGEAHCIRYAAKVRLIRFKLEAPHSEDAWTDFFCDALLYLCMREVTLGLPVPIVPAPDDVNTIWFATS